MRLAIAAGSVLLTLALAGPAAAQPGAQPAGATAPSPSPSQPQRSEGLALALSVGGTVGSWGFLYALVETRTIDSWLGVASLTTMVTLPSLGHWYAGTYFTRGTALRLSGLAVFTLGSYLWFADNPKDEPEVDRSIWPGVVLTAGAAAFLAGTIDDIVAAPGRVRRRNEAHELAIAPIVSGGSAGLAIGGRF